MNRKKTPPHIPTEEQVLSNRKYWEKVFEEPKFVNISAEQLKQYALKNLDEKVTNPIGEMFNASLDYLAKHFTSEQKKGIMLIGGYGVGKTTLMRIFQLKNKLQNCNVEYYRVVSSMQVMREFKEIGASVVDKYLSGVICFDDLGRELENAHKHYGESSNIMSEIIQERYLAGVKTNFTTNFSLAKLTEMYGEVVTSRLFEMCVIIDFKNEQDKRK